MRRFWPLALLLALAPWPAGADEPCRYRIELLDPAASELVVEARCPGGPRNFAGSRGFRAERMSGLEPIGEGAGVRYRFALGALADAAADPDVALRVGGGVVACWSALLLLPERLPELEIEAVAPAGSGVATALPREHGRFRIAAAEVPFSGYAAFGRFESRVFSAPNASDALVETAIMEGAFALSADELAAWVRDSVGIVADYLGGFGARRTLVVVIPVPGRSGVVFGRVMAGGGPALMVRVGERSDRARLDREWVLVHELLHVGTPFVLRAPWFMEGLATYAEPLLRARAGWLRPEEVWAEWLRDMPRGLAGGRLNRRQAYWGGALYMLRADVELRRRSAGAVGLETCLRAMTREGANASVRWSLERTLAFCDRATGTEVFAELSTDASEIDLDALWAELGVAQEAGRIRFDDAAPLAGVRRAIATRAP
jgi:hypothetical protein